MEELHYSLPDQETAFGAFYPQSETAIQTFLWTDVKPPDEIKLLNVCFLRGNFKNSQRGKCFFLLTCQRNRNVLVRKSVNIYI